MKNSLLTSSNELTALTKLKNIDTWQELIAYVQKLPYGRNKNRHDLSLILKEEKGSCSSKHAFLKAISIENDIPNIQLILGMYMMNNSNTKIGNTLINKGINYIPEAHCYLKINGVRTDITSKNSSFKKIENAILSEIEITPHQIAEFKVSYHKKFLKNWIKEEKINKRFEEIWEIRENCILYLSKQA